MAKVTMTPAAVSAAGRIYAAAFTAAGNAGATTDVAKTVSRDAVADFFDCLAFHDESRQRPTPEGERGQ